MKRALAIIAVIILVAIAFFTLKNNKDTELETTLPSNNPSALSITSPAFSGNSTVPVKYTCKGDNISPPLVISGIPTAAKSLALTVHDPDAPNSGWVHWLIWNIPPDTTQINEDSVPPDSVQGTTDFGKPGYGGPCPPTGTHHYIFELYALDSILELPDTTRLNELKEAIKDHTIAQSSLTGLFGAE